MDIPDDFLSQFTQEQRDAEIQRLAKYDACFATKHTNKGLMVMVNKITITPSDQQG